MSIELIVFVFLVILASSLIRTVFGFGNALLAMPLLAMTSLGMPAVTALVALVASTLALQIVIQNWRNIDLAITWRLIISSLMGIPAGLALLKVADESVVKMILALLIMGFSIFSLIKPRGRAPVSELWSFPFGFLSGVLGGAYNTNGPPIVIYGTLRRWPPEHFRATLQGYFFPTSLLILLSHGLAGFWTAQVWSLYALSIPAMIAAMIMGDWIYRRLPRKRFDQAIHYILIILAVSLIIHVIFS
ncbi:MAG: sulfite exporter TauE/SafE family protein [Smithellaceae bacterium]|nr:sulfite exporter TauE/SafE family protein [Smithellaceae bacterium]